MSRVRLLRFVFVLAAGFAASPTSSAPRFDRAGWMRDFAQLKTALEREYVNLAWMGSPQSGVDVPRLALRTQAALTASISDEEAEKALLDFVAGFRDGHLSRLPSLAGTGAAAVPEPAETVLDPADPKSGCAALGYAAAAPILFSLPFESLPGFRMIGDGLSEVVRSGLLPMPDGGRIGIVRIQAFRASAFPAACLRGWASRQARSLPLTSEAVVEAAADQWYASLAETLAALRRAGAAAILVDIGHNGGGDDSGDWIPRMLTDRTILSAPLLMVDAPMSARYFDEQIQAMNSGLATAPAAAGAEALREARAFFTARKASIGARPCDLGWVWREQRDWRPSACNRLIDAGSAGGARRSLAAAAFADPAVARRLSWSAAIERHFGAWTGPVYLFTDERSFSAAEMFAATMKDNGIARILGARTGGDGCGFMTKAEPLVLAHSRLRFRIPNCLRLRADGSDEVAGIAPDWPLDPLPGESSRARAQRALAIIAADLHGTGRSGGLVLPDRR